MLLAQLKSRAQAPPAAVLLTGLGIYAATWSSASLIEHAIEAWSKRPNAPIQAPSETPQPAPASSPRPVASATPVPAPTRPKHQERISDQEPAAPAPSPTTIAGPPRLEVTPSPDGPPVIGNLGPSGGRAHTLPHLFPHPRRIPRELSGDNAGEELPRDELGRRGFFDRERDLTGLGRREGFHHFGGPFGGGLLLMRRPFGGFSIFRPRLPFGGGGFGHRFF